jgi:capsular polysaccharide transport system permease protein
LENVTSNNATPAKSSNKNFVRRILVTNRLFLLTVALPTAIAILYFGFIAADVYVSESRFVVRSPQRQSQTGVVGALLQGTGFSKAQDDTYPVIDYIESRDALRQLNTQSYFFDAYSQRGDFLRRFNSSVDSSFEALWKYYNKYVVTVDLDSTSAITTLEVRSFTAKDSVKINEALLEMSERLINRMNERAATDSVQFSQRQVDTAAAHAKDAAAALATYRNSYTVFDPERQSALQLQQVSGLQTQLFAAQTQLIQLESISAQNPQVPVLRTSIVTLQKQIKDATSGVTGGKGSLSDKAAAYARLQLESQFADKQLASAMAALESSRAEAQRKQLYLERLVEPNDPDVAIEPKRMKGIFVVFALGMIAWGILSLLLAGVREHHD